MNVIFIAVLCKDNKTAIHYKECYRITETFAVGLQTQVDYTLEFSREMNPSGTVMVPENIHIAKNFRIVVIQMQILPSLICYLQN